MIYYFKSKAARILWLKGNFKFIIIPVVNNIHKRDHKIVYTIIQIYPTAYLPLRSVSTILLRSSLNPFLPFVYVQVIPVPSSSALENTIPFHKKICR